MSPKHTDRPAVERALQAVEALQLRLAGAHAAEFTALELTMSQAKLLYVVMAHGPLTHVRDRRPARRHALDGQRRGRPSRLGRSADPRRTTPPIGARSTSPSRGLGLAALEQMREFGERQLRSLFDHIPDDDVAVVERAMEILTRAVDAADRPTDAAGSTDPITTQTRRSR